MPPDIALQKDMSDVQRAHPNPHVRGWDINAIQPCKHILKLADFYLP